MTFRKPRSDRGALFLLSRGRASQLPASSRRSQLPRSSYRSRGAVGLAATALTLVTALSGCSGPSSPSKGAHAAGSTASSGGYPVTVSNCGTSTIYTKAPTRAVSNDVNTTEDMLALGLGPHMAGDFGVSEDGAGGNPVPDQYLKAFRHVPDVSSDYFTLEPLVGLHPDFLFAGWNYGLQAGTDLTPTGLAKYGIKTLALTESCAQVQKGTSAVSIDDTYRDLTNLGRVFDVGPKAQKLIASMKSEVEAARSKTTGLAPVRVFDYDSGTSAPFTAPGLAMPNALIELAGGTNVFAGLKKSWTSVSWEQVVAADPQCIIINDYGSPTAAQKEKFLETNAATRNITAVKNRCFLTLTYDEVTPSPRNAEAVTAIARRLHPAAFGLPANGA